MSSWDWKWHLGRRSLSRVPGRCLRPLRLPPDHGHTQGCGVGCERCGGLRASRIWRTMLSTRYRLRSLDEVLGHTWFGRSGPSRMQEPSASHRRRRLRCRARTLSASPRLAISPRYKRQAVPDQVHMQVCTTVCEHRDDRQGKALEAVDNRAEV